MPEDTLQSLSLAYTTPVGVLRRTNNLFSDHLLAARRTILVPGEYYKGGVSLSPRPVEGEEEELKKSKVRRWMVACKVAEYVYTQCFAPFDGVFFHSSSNSLQETEDTVLIKGVFCRLLDMTSPFFISNNQIMILTAQ